MAACYRRDLLLSAASLVVILVTTDLLVRKLVVDKLKRSLGAVERAAAGHRDVGVLITTNDEISELSQACTRVAAGLAEKTRLEQKIRERTQELQAQAGKLSALNNLAVTVSGSLDLRQILRNALDEVLRSTRLNRGLIALRKDLGVGFEPMVSRGLPEGLALADVQCAWSGSICSQVFEQEPPIAFPDGVEHPCLAADYLQKEGLMFRACVALKSKDQFLGALSLIGEASTAVEEFDQDAVETLTAFGRQIGIAVENASLYEALREKEALQRQLLETVISAQEGERQRIARELHDQTGQALTSLIFSLKVLEEATSLDEVRERTVDLRDATTQILRDVRDLSLELRPSVLDELGLPAALRHYVKRYRRRFDPIVDLQVIGLDGTRLPPAVETALFRIAQEALTNVAKHAQARLVTVLLECRSSSVMLIVEDDGNGLDVTRLEEARPHEGTLGVHGMRERASLLNGSLTIESTLGTGTAVFARIPLGTR